VVAGSLHLGFSTGLGCRGSAAHGGIGAGFGTSKVRSLSRSLVNIFILGSCWNVRWRWSASGQYSSRSAYHAMFAVQSSMLRARELWKVKAPHKCLLMLWLALQDQVWTYESAMVSRRVTHAPSIPSCRSP
jgi:hypothetical protein